MKTNKIISQIRKLLPQNSLIFILISLGMIFIHMLFMSNLLPWIDEVMYTDAPLHYVSGDGWITHAWSTNAGREPVSLAAPIYQFLLTGWMWIFGTSLWASRSLNLVILLLIGLGILKLTERVDVKMDKGGVVVFALLLWCTPAMMFMFRNGRTDLTGALICILLFIQIIDYLKGKAGKRWLIILFSALAFLTNLPAVIFATLVLLLGIVFLKGMRKKAFWATVWAFVGFFIGFCLMALYFLSKGALLAFLENLFAFSGFLKSLAAVVFPYIGPALGLDSDYYMAKFVQENSAPAISFGTRIMEVLRNPSYIILLLSIITIVVICYKQIKQCSNKKVIYGLLLLGILIPILMLMIGRFASYYYWMALLPLFLCLSILYTKDEGWIGKSIVISIVIVLAVLGGRVVTEKSHYSEMRSFINESVFLKDKVIASPFAPFYEVERMSNKVYYPEVMSEENLPEHFDYIIMPKCQTVAEKKIERLFNSIKGNETNEVRLVATCQEPYLVIFEVVDRTKLHKVQ